MPQKIGIIVQRYGLEINGGAEYHARLIAERLARHFAVEVFTTSALDYITWDHHYTDNHETINGIPVHRFRVRKPRDPQRFGRIQELVFREEHTLADEETWLEEEGPLVPHLLDELEHRNGEFSHFIFFSYRYYHSYHGIGRFPAKSLLVPTAEADEVIFLRLFKEFFHLPAAIVYNSHEEREMIHRISANRLVPGDVVGVASEIPARFDPAGAIQKHDLTAPFCLYIGRLDENKGVPQLFQFFLQFLRETAKPIDLVLVGRTYIDIPDHPQIRHLGFLSDQAKFDLLTGSEFLLIPSQYESLSMVCLEAWALGKPVLVNGRTPVLKGQCQRSQAGLWYENYDEFKATFSLLLDRPDLRAAMGRHGRDYFQNNYSWEVIEQKYLYLLTAITTRNTQPD